MMSLIAITMILPAVFAAETAELAPNIVNGTLALPGQFPYQVYLDIKPRSYCGGSILNADYVITAAHCVNEAIPANVTIYAGTVDIRLPYSVHHAQKIYSHEKYNAADSYVNDIALIKVTPRFVKSALVSFVPLPRPSEVVEANDEAIVSGFGMLEDVVGARTYQLYWTVIEIVSQDYCSSVYKPLNLTIYPTQLCAGKRLFRTGPCHGDSGGPLTVRGKLVGIVSLAKGCALPAYPTVFTRVTSYLNWIKKHAV